MYRIKIYLIDINKNIVSSWKREFLNVEDVIIKLEDLKSFLDCNINDIKAIVSPGNSYGIMNGGFDLALTNYFGNQLSNNVSKYIKEHYYPYQSVGSSFIIDIPNYKNIKLIHTPTMIVPSTIFDEKVIYNCMYNSLMCAFNNNITSIVIPAFGGATGGVDPKVIAREMRLAYNDFIKYVY